MTVDVTVSNEVHSIVMQQISPSCAYAKYWHSSDVMPSGRNLAYGTRGHVITNTYFFLSAWAVTAQQVEIKQRSKWKELGVGGRPFRSAHYRLLSRSTTDWHPEL